MRILNTKSNICCKDINVLGNIFCSFIGNLKYECVLAAYLDENMTLKGVVELACGTGTRVEHTINDIYMCALHFSTRNIVLAHNHPDRNIHPSSGDIRATEAIANTLKVNNVILVDHLLICGDEYCSIYRNN